MPISRRSSRAAALLAVLTLGVTTPALAQDDFVVTHDPKAGTTTRSMEIDISDLRLSTAKGRATLQHRINLAARSVCDHQDSLGMREFRDYRHCYNRATDNALGQVHPVQTASR
ncbi:UrcA family protein [Sphingobium aquiterrae]|uniref:UrcA family protein n=1 Tax=Sphingobium aquiterrae TaxID=2038656 RepID=UPI00301AF2C1